MSTAPPMQPPWMAAITGMRASSRQENVVLQAEHQVAEGLVGDVRVLLAGRQRAVLGEHLQVHAGREVLAGGRDDDHAGPGVVVDVAHDRRQRVPERAVHGC